jgi:hypothetical protein
VKSNPFDELRQAVSLRAYRIAIIGALATGMTASGAILINHDPGRVDSERLVGAVHRDRGEQAPASRGEARAVALLPAESAPEQPASAHAQEAAPETSATGTAEEPATTGQPATESAAEAAAEPASEAEQPAPPPAAHELSFEYQGQINYYYCGPAATRIALTALGHGPSQDAVAGVLGTTTSGTNSAYDTTRALNSISGTDAYRTTTIPGGAATPAEMDRLQADVVAAISGGRAVVANIAGSATDTVGGWHSYPGGHYVTVVGYADEGRTVKIADPAAGGTYWMTTISLAHWIATRGYSA